MPDAPLGHLEKTLVRQQAPTAAVSPPPAPSGRYRLGAELGRGGMGRVVEAVDTQFDRVVAVKELLGPPDADSLRRFRTEALVTGNLEHPGIPAVHEHGLQPGGTPFYAMQRVVGRTLSECCRQATGVKERLMLLPAVIKVAQTVGFAHSRGVVHRDLKPDNVIVGDHGQVWVLDWGLARVRGLAEAGSSGAISGADNQTVAGAVMGTPAYMAPEQALGEGARIDERTDVFALGALLFHVLTGRAPYSASTLEGVLAQAQRGEVSSLRVLAPGAPRSLVEICAHAMSREPGKRHPNAHELAAELERRAAEALTSNRRMVDWAANVLGGITAVLVLGVLATIIVSGALPTLRERGPLSVVVLFLGAVAAIAAAFDLATRRRYGLTWFAASLTGGTVMATIGLTTLGFLGVLQGLINLAQREGSWGSPELVRLGVMGAREALGNLPAPMLLVGAALILCGFASRITPPRPG